MYQANVIALKSTGAIGDFVIASAIPVSLEEAGYQTAIISKKFILPLWNGLSSTSTFGEEELIPENAVLVDISDYLAGMPHSNNLPPNFTASEIPIKGHLCEWMACSIFDKTGINIRPDRDHVRVVLNSQEVAYGKTTVHKVSKENGNLPVVIIAPYSTTKNRNIPKNTLEQVAKGISGFAVPCLLEPYTKNQYIEGTVPIGHKNLRKASAILYASTVYVGVDSGPLHMINGALQGTPVELAGDINVDKGKVIAVLGSSHPDVVSYAQNQTIVATGGCSIGPCGVHGYWLLEKYEQKFGVSLYKSGNQTDGSGCIFNDYALGTASCMQAISAEKIIETVRLTLN